MALRWTARAAMQRWRTAASEQRRAISSISGASETPFCWWRPPSTEMEACGRGDKKTQRGKRFKGSYGNARPKLKQRVERIKDRVEVPRSTPWPLPFKLI